MSTAALKTGARLTLADLNGRIVTAPDAGRSTPRRSGPGEGVRALGRLKTGAMNKTEARYDAHLWAQRSAGTVIWHAFEAIKLRLADNTFFTADFVVQVADRTIELHDVKGARAIFEEDARVKIKVAAAMYPIFGLVAIYPRRPSDGGGWDREDFSA